MQLKLTERDLYDGYTEADFTVTTAMRRIQRQVRQLSDTLAGYYDIATGDCLGTVYADMWHVDESDIPAGVRISGGADCTLADVARAIAQYRRPADWS